jgi:hypothetical protein
MLFEADSFDNDMTESPESREFSESDHGYPVAALHCVSPLISSV